MAHGVSDAFEKKIILILLFHNKYSANLNIAPDMLPGLFLISTAVC